MDFSSLTEAQKQQLQQLQEQFQQHQLKRQQEQQQQQELFASHSYDPSQVQPYDQSTQQAYDQSSQAYDQSNQAYYPYSHYPTHHQQQQQQHQHYPYYHQDYANAYQPQQLQTESTPIQPLGVSPVAPEASLQGQNQSAYYPQGATEQQQNLSSSSSYPVPSGLNPAAAAAVAALSQLTQFAGSMDAAQRAVSGLQERQWQANNGGGGYGPMSQMPHPAHGGFHHLPYPVRPGTGGSPYNRGGGRRGGGPFRGNQGYFGNRHPRPDGSGPYSRGRGRVGRDGGRLSPSHGSSSSPYPEVSVQESDAALAHDEAAQAAEKLGEGQQTAPVSFTAAKTAGIAQRSTWRPPQIAWCELCRVDCTSLDILEQHKNGKKHKKNLQRFEVMQNSRNPNTIPISMPVVAPDPAPGSAPDPAPGSAPAPGPYPNTTQASAPLQTAVPLQNEQKSMAEGESETTAENVNGAEIIKQSMPENLPTGATVDDNKVNSEQQNEVAGQSEEAAEVEAAEGTTRKRRMDRFDNKRRGLKRKLRGGRGGKRMRVVEQRQPEPPEEVVPMICDLCNVKCDTQAVFDCHLAGKKHLSKLKRFQGHQAMYGPVGLQALYPPNPNTQSIVIPPQVRHDHQQPIYMPPQQPMMAYGPPQGQQIVAAAAAATEQKLSLDSEMQGQQITSGGVQMAGPVDPRGQQGAAPVAQEDQQQAVAATAQNGV